jgi:hypothetical protein
MNALIVGRKQTPVILIYTMKNSVREGVLKAKHHIAQQKKVVKKVIIRISAIGM